ncbi:MAG: hypothetical protein F6K08_02360 [Okeania sp. SIO1H6]|nr:hypothetical protein [Okeania sp. SIO1H6]
MNLFVQLKHHSWLEGLYRTLALSMCVAFLVLLYPTNANAQDVGKVMCSKNDEQTVVCSPDGYTLGENDQLYIEAVNTGDGDDYFYGFANRSAGMKRAILAMTNQWCSAEGLDPCEDPEPRGNAYDPRCTYSFSSYSLPTAYIKGLVDPNNNGIKVKIFIDADAQVAKERCDQFSPSSK